MSLLQGGLTDHGFEELFGEAVVMGLTNILGPSGAQATIKHMELGVKPADPEKIDAKLVMIFSKSGALVIERQIVRALFEKLNERFLERSRLSFKQKIDEVRLRFESFEREGA